LLSGVIIDLSTWESVSYVDITILDNATGDPIEPSLTGQTDENGNFEIEVPAELLQIGIQFTLVQNSP